MTASSLYPKENLENNRAVSWRILVRYRTTRIEQLFLILTIGLVPLENHLPTISGISLVSVIFVLLGGYVLCKRPAALAGTLWHPVFITAYVWICLVFLVELTHPFASYNVIFRMGQMVGGAVVLSALCGDPPALRASMYGYVIAGLWLSVFLFLTTYRDLQGAQAVSFTDATLVRGEVLGETSLAANWNTLAFIAAQGAIVALALGLRSASRLRCNLFFGCALFCLTGTFLPMSRGGIGIAIVSCATVMLASGAKWGKSIVVASLVGVSIAMWVPDVVWSRLTLSPTQSKEGKIESRERIYKAAIEHFPEYVMTGVGAGNFWKSWGLRSRFAHHLSVSGAHNVFLQAMIYWGISGLILLVALIWKAYQCLPKRCGDDPLALSLFGIAVSLLLFMFVMHRLYAKELAIGLGLLVSARRWIWPTGKIQPASQTIPASLSSRPHL